MSLEEAPGSLESDVTSMRFEDTELTLGLPGEGRSPAVIAGVKCSAKRGFVETVDLKLGSCSRAPSGGGDTHVNEAGAGKPPPAKAQVIGWPPVRSSRKKAINESCKYVKVAVDGAPYLRKVNLGVYSNYHDLMKDLENLFTCCIIREYQLISLSLICIHLNRKADREESKVMDAVKGMEYVPTYEDKDGDWMLVGDVPWKMFIESCKRIRLMKSSEAAVLAPKASLKCSGTC
ncbi:Indoleacetic acid-induced protein 16, putative [Theobroma cacao]|uniref:Auxin-responsive protein n=1 Tax=Theobroma cacao TaxID=3641 RepID=A0A061GNB7_THECC|nr:Indoleacetic acid-induced protein 16, putative [Theobroma cacao]